MFIFTLCFCKISSQTIIVFFSIIISRPNLRNERTKKNKDWNNMDLVRGGKRRRIFSLKLLEGTHSIKIFFSEITLRWVLVLWLKKKKEWNVNHALHLSVVNIIWAFRFAIDRGQNKKNPRFSFSLSLYLSLCSLYVQSCSGSYQWLSMMFKQSLRANQSLIDRELSTII